MSFPTRRGKTNAIVFIYAMGLLFLAIYLPYQARSSPSFLVPSIDAGYSWVWSRPIYYDTEKNKNLTAADLEEWRAKNIDSPLSVKNLLNPWLEESERNRKALPSTWIQIYGIDYTRLFFSFAVWTLAAGGLLYVLKKDDPGPPFPLP